MTRDIVKYEYFEWMYDMVTGERFGRPISYRKLLTYLHDTEFIYFIPRDANRAQDGIDLRYSYALSQGDRYLCEYLDGPCSVLEMILALAIKCEVIMDDPDVGDRTGQWFWGMINNLGLGSSVDSNFDIYYVDEVVTNFLHRNYEPDGKGGLFTVKNRRTDLREVEIWYQLNWYLDKFV